MGSFKHMMSSNEEKSEPVSRLPGLRMQAGDHLGLNYNFDLKGCLSCDKQDNVAGLTLFLWVGIQKLRSLRNGLRLEPPWFCMNWGMRLWGKVECPRQELLHLLTDVINNHGLLLFQITLTYMFSGGIPRQIGVCMSLIMWFQMMIWIGPLFLEKLECWCTFHIIIPAQKIETLAETLRWYIGMVFFFLWPTENTKKCGRERRTQKDFCSVL